MQIDFRKIGTDWVDFENITTPVEDKTYQIYNWGPSTVCVLEADATPSDKGGVLILPYGKLYYKKGAQKLFLKALDKAEINITMEG